MMLLNIHVFSNLPRYLSPSEPPALSHSQVPIPPVAKRPKLLQECAGSVPFLPSPRIMVKGSEVAHNLPSGFGRSPLVKGFGSSSISISLII